MFRLTQTGFKAESGASPRAEAECQPPQRLHHVTVRGLSARQGKRRGLSALGSGPTMVRARWRTSCPSRLKRLHERSESSSALSLAEESVLKELVDNEIRWPCPELGGSFCFCPARRGFVSEVDGWRFQPQQLEEPVWDPSDLCPASPISHADKVLTCDAVRRLPLCKLYASFALCARRTA